MERYVAIDNVCAWPNLTKLPDGTVAAVIFNQPSHGSVAGDVHCWASEDRGQTWQRRGTVAPHEPNTNRMNVAVGLASDGHLVAVCSGWSNRYPPGQSGGAFRAEILDPWVCRSADGGRTWTIDKTTFPPRAPDGGYANIRVLRNRCFNGMAAPLSIQPVYAGPVYWIRNVLYNAHKGARAFKLEAGVNDNVICYHNTLTNHWTNSGGLHFGDVRNNLFMGPAGYVTERDRQRERRVLDIGFRDPSGILDHNAHRVGLPVEKPFVFKELVAEVHRALGAPARPAQ